jgi:hypothetical protein
MRTKDTCFNFRTLSRFVGVPEGSRKFRRIQDSFFPERSGVPGETVQVYAMDFLKAAVLLQLWDCDVSDEHSALVIRILGPLMRRDYNDGLPPGLLVVARREYPSIRYLPRRLWDGSDWPAIRNLIEGPRFSDSAEDGGRVARMLAGHETYWIDDPVFSNKYNELYKQAHAVLKKPTAEGVEAFNQLKHLDDSMKRKPASFVLIDLQAILQEVYERSAEYSEERNVAPLSVEDMVQAFTVASQVRDDVDSATVKK